MSVTTVDYTIEETASQRHDCVVEGVIALLDHQASLRRSFTRYEPRHRADGPAL